MPRIPLAKPTFTNEMINKYNEYVREILSSGRLTLGKYTKMFEERLARVLGVKQTNVVSVSSGTAALHTIMMVYKISSGDEVIVPSLTFASTVNAPLYVGATPVLADSDPETYNISTDAVQELISSKTKAIIAVHIGGNPADMKVLREIADDHKLILIEDAAHAIGAICQSKPCGTWGDAAAFSFYPNKVITTGEGGAIVLKDKKLAERARVIRNIGRASLGPADVVELGYNYRMSELEAALGIIQLDMLDYLLENRRKIASLYDQSFSKDDRLIIQKVKHGMSSYYAYLLRLVTENTKRDMLREMLLNKYGIETTIIYRPVHQFTYYTRNPFIKIPKKLENAELIGDTNIALPIYGHMSLEEATYVITSLKKSLNTLLQAENSKEN